MTNIRQSGRVRKTVDYTFSEFDQEILDAVCRDTGWNKRSGCSATSQSIAATPGTRQSKRLRTLYNDSDSDSNYDPDSPMVDQQIPQHPERHVYLRRNENGVLNGSEDLKDGIKVGTEEQEDSLSGNLNNGLTTDENASPRDGRESDSSDTVETNKSSSQSPEDVKNLGNTIVETCDSSSVENSKISNLNSEGAKHSVDTIAATAYISCNENMHFPDVLSKDTLKSSSDYAQMKLITPENVTNDGNILNGNECTPVVSNCNILLNSRDVSLLAQEDEQPDMAEKNQDDIHESQTTNMA